MHRSRILHACLSARESLQEIYGFDYISSLGHRIAEDDNDCMLIITDSENLPSHNRPWDGGGMWYSLQTKTVTKMLQKAMTSYLKNMSPQCKNYIPSRKKTKFHCNQVTGASKSKQRSNQHSLPTMIWIFSLSPHTVLWKYITMMTAGYSLYIYNFHS